MFRLCRNKRNMFEEKRPKRNKFYARFFFTTCFITHMYVIFMPSPLAREPLSRSRLFLLCAWISQPDFATIPTSPLSVLYSSIAVCSFVYQCRLSHLLSNMAHIVIQFATELMLCFQKKKWPAKLDNSGNWNYDWYTSTELERRMENYMCIYLTNGIFLGRWIWNNSFETR